MLCDHGEFAEPPLPLGPGLIACVVAGAAVSFAHTVLPTHWAPFLATARARRWGTGTLLAVALAGALAHALSTAVLGALAAAAGHSAWTRFGPLFETAAGAGLVLIGAGVALQALRGGHAHGAARPDRASRSDLAAAAGLVMLMLASPCEVALPVYLSAAPYGFGGGIVLTAGVAAGTALGMMLAVLGARAGLARLASHRWERYEAAALGAALAALGAWILLVGG